MAGKVVLYSYFRSSASWRVRIALALKGIEYEYEAVHLVKDGGRQHTEEYRKLNPLGQLPCLTIDGYNLIQSLPIIEYLEDRNPEPPLLPKDSAGKAKVRCIAEIVNSGIQPLQNLGVLQKIGDTKAEWAAHFITKGFVALETILKDCAGKYCYGDTVTLADICLLPQVASSQRFNVDMSAFPTISRIYATLEDHPAFKVADSRRQPDTPEEMKIE